jgi:hypothetical protein
MNRLEIAKQEEQAAFLRTFQEVLRRHNVKIHDFSVPQAMKFLRESIRKGPSPLNNELARAVFTGTKLFPLLERSVSFLEPPERTEDLFGKTRKAAVGFGAHDTSHSLWYMLCHPKLVWSALTSVWIGHTLFGKVFPYDPKGFAKNISGLLFEEKRGENSSILWTMGPTPTLGNILAPETECALESLEQGEKWVYVNLQSLGCRDERPRSLTLLEASKRYQGRFCAASLSVDSPLYKGREGGDIQEHKKMLLNQLSRAIFLKDTSWYFFSLQGKQKEMWWSIVEEVVELSLALSQGLIPVFHELVVLGLIRAWQAFHMKDVNRLISTIACKECIDRGGSVNAAFMWALLGDDVGKKERARKVMAILWGRPLLARRRLIDKSRTIGFQALVAALPAKEVRHYLETVWNIASPGPGLAASSRLVL